MTITQVITPLPAAPNPATDTPTVFSEKAAAFVASQQAMVPEINAWRVQANALEANVNAKEAATDADVIATAGLKNTAQAAADAAESYRTQAQASAAAAAASATTIGITAAFSDANPVVKDSADPSKQLKFEVGGFTPGATRTVTMPNKSGTMAMLEDSGLVFLGEITLASPAANIDFLTIFNGGQYDRFLITIQKAGTGVGGGNLAIRYAVAGAVDASSSYQLTVYGAGFGSLTTQLQVGVATTSPLMYSEFTLYNNESGTSKASHSCSPTTASGELYRGNYYTASPTVLSGFRVFAVNGSNIITGTTVRVYGFRKT